MYRILWLGVTDDKYIYWEYESGTKDDRAEFQKLMDIVSEGDTIATTEVSRLTRSTKHLCEILQTVKDKKLILDIGGSFRVDCSKGEMDPMTEGMPEYRLITKDRRNHALIRLLLQKDISQIIPM